MKIRVVKNQVALANVLRVERKSVQRWLKIAGNPGHKADGRFDVVAWRKWVRQHGRKDGSDLDKNQLQATNILLQNQKLEFKLAILRRDYVPAHLVQQWGGELGAAIRKVVTQIHLIAPSVVGLPVPDAETRLKEVEDEILDQLNGLAEQLKQWQEVPVGT